jgi:uncharacterized protein (TIGR03437 family)
MISTMRFLLLLAILCAGGLAGANLVFDNTFGGNQIAGATAIALDLQGNIYVTGTTQSQANSGLTTIFVNKWSPDGSQLLYTTNFGGNGSTVATGIAVDSAGSAYITGFTSSSNFPVTSNAIQPSLAAPFDAFVTKLSPDGSQMVYSTLLGGSGSERAYAQAYGIAVDSGGNAIVTGSTQGTNFQVTPNAFQSAPVSGCTANTSYINVSSAGDAFISKIAPDGGSLVYSTLLGGSCATFGLALALDGSGNAWVTGYTSSPDFPVTSGATQPQFAGGGYDGYLAQFTSGGALAYASYLGGSGFDSVTGITLDASGAVYVAGVTSSVIIPSLGPLPDSGSQCVILSIGPPELTYAGVPFLAKLTPITNSGGGFSYLDGTCAGNVLVALDATGAPWIAGAFQIGPTPSLSTVSPLQIGGGGFLTKFSSDFQFPTPFSTYFDTINGLALDSSGFAYIAGAGPLASTQVTTTQAAFVAKIDPTPPPISLDQVLATGSVVYESNLELGVAPGEVLRLIGRGIGPTAATPGIINSSDIVTTSVAGVEVTFGGVPAPLLSVSAGEIDCIAPFEIASQGGTTSIQIQYNGTQSNPVQMNVEATAVEVLAVLNPYFVLNSSSNADPDSTVTLYLAGVGQTNPPSQDGQVNQAPFAQSGVPIQLQYSEPGLNNGVTVNAQILYAGAAPGLIAGILQVNFVAPPPGSAPITVTVQVPGSRNNFPVSIFFITPNP